MGHFSFQQISVSKICIDNTRALVLEERALYVSGLLLLNYLNNLVQEPVKDKGGSRHLQALIPSAVLCLGVIVPAASPRPVVKMRGSWGCMCKSEGSLCLQRADFTNLTFG